VWASVSVTVGIDFHLALFLELMSAESILLHLECLTCSGCGKIKTDCLYSLHLCGGNHHVAHFKNNPDVMGNRLLSRSMVLVVKLQY